jgi:hypothetical protein
MTSTSNTVSNFNPQFIVSKANHIILKKCIDNYLEIFINNKSANSRAIFHNMMFNIGNTK